MTETFELKLYGAIKSATHLAVISISTLLTINLFMNFSENGLYKILWLILACSVELGKVYIFVMGKAYFSLATKSSIVKGLALIIIYLGLAIVSLISNTGFSLLSISEKESLVVEQNLVSNSILIDREITQLENDIEFALSERKANAVKKEELPTDWVVNRREIQAIIDDLTNEIGSKNERINTLLLEKQQVVQVENIDKAQSVDIFSLLGAGKLAGDKVMLYLMLFISLLIELLTIVTSGTYPLKSKKDSKEVIKVEPKQEAVEEIEVVTDLPVSTPKVAMTIDKKGILEYLNVMFEDGIAKLKNDIEISKKTGIKLNTCKAYRRQLLSMTYNNKSIIVAKKGKGTHSTMPLRSVKKLIQLEMNVEDK